MEFKVLIYAMLDIVYIEIEELFFSLHVNSLYIFCFQILSGDSVIIRGASGAPPPEKQLYFSSVIAPKLARRAVGKYVFLK